MAVMDGGREEGRDGGEGLPILDLLFEKVLVVCSTFFPYWHLLLPPSFPPFLLFPLPFRWRAIWRSSGF
jgi:hypothetical protein